MMNRDSASCEDEVCDVSCESAASDDAATGAVSLAYPEGGRDAWCCLVGSALIMFPSFGFQTAVGTVQDYITIHQLSGYSVEDIGWISALLVFLTLFLGVQVGPVFDRYGPRLLLAAGSIGSVASYLLLAQCAKYWHFMLTLSVLGGISSAIVTTVAISVLSHWFERRRALVTGICMAGSSAGGAILPIVLRTTFEQYGWAWSLRVVAFIALACYVLAIFLVKGRQLPTTGNGPPSRATINFRAFKSPRLCFLALAVFSFEFIIFGCAALLPTYARYAGFSSHEQFYTLTVLNSMSLLGRVLPGLAADIIGRFNVLLAMMLLTLVIMAGVWVPFGQRNEATLYAVVAVFGFGSGGWISLAPVCAGQLCRTEEYGRFYGTVYSVAAFGTLLTVPVGGEMLAATTPQLLVGFYAAVLVFGLVNVVCSRWALLEWKWRWTAKV
ncbi:putative MFS monocarboxylate transporter [Aspergillus homomorphus CBS 101889]|uniref:MFS general substrate transporter n=1 Tax=Aspergillus homomorphus (strain CBS 101889) TaxID=1450537 RepID=A0A395HRA8_ASPHC|nr:MFS general substrate transporter [Aspergillus homomorphus CBS 101889]RAL08794.1 MFS general substrate transporter [Aspergillus homomorphus CBS 101889]